MEEKVVKMEKIVVKMEKMEKMEKTLVILEKIIVTIHTIWTRFGFCDTMGSIKVPSKSSIQGMSGT